jgi:hypothetical protein
VTRAIRAARAIGAALATCSPCVGRDVADMPATMRLAFVLLLFVGCSKHEAPQPAPALPPLVADAETPTISVKDLPAEKPYVYTTTLAHFDKDQLFECVDFAVTMPAYVDAGADPLGSLHKSMATGVKRIEQPCEVAFQDRTVLASCARSETGDAGKSVEVTAHFYRFEDVGLSDQQMSDCLDAKARWSAIARDSQEWRRAKLDYDDRRLHKAIDRANSL